ITSSITQVGTMQSGIVALIDGHEYTNYNLWPGVECREYLSRVEHNNANPYHVASLHGWKCKEYTIGVRSVHTTYPVKVCAIVWYYLKKATREELLEYAVKHPHNPDAFKVAMRGKTVETEEG
ncbi:unnamed protein product, partial [marine sediment metagenome]